MIDVSPFIFHFNFFVYKLSYRLPQQSKTHSVLSNRFRNQTAKLKSEMIRFKVINLLLIMVLCGFFENTTVFAPSVGHSHVSIPNDSNGQFQSILKSEYPDDLESSIKSAIKLSTHSKIDAPPIFNELPMLPKEKGIFQRVSHPVKSQISKSFEQWMKNDESPPTPAYVSPLFLNLVTLFYLSLNMIFNFDLFRFAANLVFFLLEY